MVPRKASVEEKDKDVQQSLDVISPRMPVAKASIGAAIVWAAWEIALVDFSLVLAQHVNVLFWDAEVDQVQCLFVVADQNVFRLQVIVDVP